MKVSVVTPNYNGEKFLKTFFDSLNEDSELIGELIIIDNGSTDKSKEYIENYSFWMDIQLMLLTLKILFWPDSTEGVENDQITALKQEMENSRKSE